MNDLGKRLRDLADQATTGTSVTNPSFDTPVPARSQRGRSAVCGLIAAMAVVTMLLLWQGRDTSTTSVAAGQGEETGADFFQDGVCAVEPVLELLRAGIPTYDYEPAGSFDALANNSAAVVAGQVVSIARNDVNGRSYIEITVAGVFEVPTVNQADATRDDLVVIAYEATWADGSRPDPLASPIVVDGLDFFGFLSPWSGVRGGWAPGPEGLYVHCNGPWLPVMASGAGPNEPTDPNEWWARKQAEQAAGQAMAEAAAAMEEPFFHTVEEGDRLDSIAEKYNVTVDVVLRANPQMDPNVLILGEQLRIPAAATNGDAEGAGPNRAAGVAGSYVVQPGDTLGAMASMWTVSLDALLEANPGVDPATLEVNQVLIIPPWGTGLDAYQLTPLATPQAATPATPEDLKGLQAATIELARELWETSEIDSYLVRYSEFRSQGMAKQLTVNVDAGAVAATEPADTTGSAYTIDDLFDLAASVDTVREFEFDTQTGYPTVLSVDPDNTVSGDEFALRTIEVVSRSEVDAADQRIQDWLPEPLEASEPVSPSDELAPLYLLHDDPAYRVLMFLKGDDICVEIREVTDGAETGVGFGTCIWKTDFLGAPIRLEDTTTQRGLSLLLLVVPPLDYSDQDWTAEGEGGRLDVTSRSVLLAQDADTTPERALIHILCDCGDLTFTAY